MLWSCTNCGACVNQCPVDIEHVDHIIDMRRYQVLVESNFPAELSQLFRGLEGKGNPWNMSSSQRMDWAKGLDFDVPVVGEDLESLESVDWLFWVGCAGAYEDRAKKTTRAVAELLNLAGISFGVLGNGETCTGDPARRAGNEFVYQGLAQENVETLTEAKVKQVVTTCAHCFNTLKNEYRDLGLELEVVHHTQLLNRLVREGKLTPVAEGAGAAKRSITYHDPCFLGRHNQVYSPPRELLQVLPGAEYVEMERSQERSFCCGAGGARMWMEERIGERINENRTSEAVATGADQIAVGCPFCRVMLYDGLTAAQAAGEAREEVEVLDVAQMLLASVKGVSATKAAVVAGAAPGPAAPPAARRVRGVPDRYDGRRGPTTVAGRRRLAVRHPSTGEEKPAERPAARCSTTPRRSSTARRRPRRAPTPRSSPSDDRGPAGRLPVRREHVALRHAGAHRARSPPSTSPRPSRSRADPSAAPTTGKIDESTSLFDVGDAPAPPAAEPRAGARRARAGAGRQAEPAKPAWPASCPTTCRSSMSATGPPRPRAPRPDPVALSQAATAAAADDPDTILDADDEPEPEKKAEPAAKPADGKIDDASSLFDL